MIHVPLARFYDFLDRPLFMSSRFVLAALVVPLVLSFTGPLWRISMEAPQYPNGLWMDIYAYKLEAGNDGQHMTEINTLNHYIGMHPIDRTALADLDWIPFALGWLAIYTLRVAVIGNVRGLIDLFVMTSYISLFAFGRFIYKMYTFGHDLNPHAPVHVQPFTPAIFGSKQVANFMTHSFPQAGSYWMAVFATGVVAVTLWHLIAGRLKAEHDIAAAAG